MPLEHDDMTALFTRWMRGDKAAVAFLANVAYMTRLADDIADGDSPDPVTDVSHLLFRALIENGKNPFYQKHKDVLDAALSQALLQWEVSERWAKSDSRKSRIFAYVYREGVEQILHTCALLVGGYTHASGVMDELHAASHLSSKETFEDWETEHGYV